MQNLHFWIFSENSVKNDLHTPFLPYYDTQHLICKKFNFVRRRVPEQKIVWYLKLISIKVCKKIFLIKAKKKICCTWCPKSAVKILIFEYFQIILSEMNFTHPFYPILIPNTSYVKMFILVVGGYQNSKKCVEGFFWLKQKKYFVLGVPKVLWKSSFLNISKKNSYRYERHTPFLPNFDNDRITGYPARKTV